MKPFRDLKFKRMIDNLKIHKPTKHISELEELVKHCGRNNRLKKRGSAMERFEAFNMLLNK